MLLEFLSLTVGFVQCMQALCCIEYFLMLPLQVQSTAHQTIHLGLCTALILRVLALISNCKCLTWRAVDHTSILNACNSTIHTYPSRLIPEGGAEASQIFLRDVLLKLYSHEKYCPSQLISGVSAINPLVAFYDIHGRKREVLFFYFVPNTTRDIHNTYLK
jgi:hypothetical protein